jgi:hypothetical protein
MAFTSSNIANNRPQPEVIKEAPIPTTIQNQLNAQELALLIGIIKQTSFLGEHIELTYNTIIKLQNQYLQLT